MQVVEDDELVSVEYVPGGHPEQTGAPAPPPASEAGIDGGATGAGALQSVVSQLQLPAALMQVPSDDAVDEPTWHDPWDAPSKEDVREHQPQDCDSVHALHDKREAQGTETGEGGVLPVENAVQLKLLMMGSAEHWDVQPGVDVQGAHVAVM